ncbi:MAG: acetyltransferase [Chloroflexi bacterium]|nr:acetyltransferase [Chloroflexota bacterium]
MTAEPVAIVGVGDHARVVADLVRSLGREVAGFISPDHTVTGGSRETTPMIGHLNAVSEWAHPAIEFIVAIGDNARRAEAYETCAKGGARPAVLIHPTAILLGGADVRPGAQVCAGAVIGVNAIVMPDAIINTGATIDHDCVVQTHATVAPGAHLAGRVAIEVGAYVGIGATVRQALTVGSWALVGAGAAVVSDVAPRTRVAGVPARPMSRRE